MGLWTTHCSRIVSVVSILATLIYCLSSFSFPLLMIILQEAVMNLAPPGILIFLCTYVIATLLFAPALLFSILAGVCFPYWKAVILAYGSAMFVAAASFLAARFIFHKRRLSFLGSHPLARLIDQGLKRDGWKCIILTRFSPFVSFGLQNYLYGLSGISFSAYIIASGFALLPPAFFYSYLGYLTRTSITTSTSEFLQTAMLLLGYGSTLLLLFYSVRLIIKCITSIKHGQRKQLHRQYSLTTTLILGTIGILFPLFVLWSNQFQTLQERVLAMLPGPPRVLADEQITESSPMTVDHSLFDSLLDTILDTNGLVNLTRLRQEEETLKKYLSHLEQLPLEHLNRDESLALLLNTYNACTLALLLEDPGHQDSAPYTVLPDKDSLPCMATRESYTLFHIKHHLLRSKIREPRIHFALYCSAKNCPPLHPAAFRSSTLEEQLSMQTRRVLSDDSWCRFDEETNILYLSPVIRWYLSDFLQYAPHPLPYLAPYQPRVQEVLKQGVIPTIRWLPYA